jgi:flavin-dependent dehydrogenase
LPQLQAECLVAGAGPAGLTLARLLSLKGRHVVVVDPELPATRRLELLAPAALRTIAAAGLSNLLFDRTIARPCLGIRRWWGSMSPEYEDFLRHPYRIGYVVERARFDHRLRELAATAGVAFIKGRVTGLDRGRGGVCLTIRENGTETLAFGETIVDATGRAAVVARRNGARIAIRDRRVAELMEERCVAPNTSAPTWLDVWKGDEASWSYRIHGVDGKAQLWSVRRTATEVTPGAILLRVDASAGILSAIAGEGWMAVGDAASSFDPIASQGLFNALSSALVAAGALRSSHRLTAGTASLYADTVAAAFLFSEARRSRVYGRSLKVTIL